MTQKNKTDNVPKFEGRLIRQEGDTYIIERPNGTCAVLQHNSLPSMTHQEFAADADINNIMKRYVYSDLPDMPSVVSEFSQMVDYHEVMTEAMRARDAFMLLPGNIRQRFGNNPQELINFLGDERNRDEAEKLGLINKKPIPQPDPILTELQTLNKTLSTSTKNKKIEE